MLPPTDACAELADLCDGFSCLSSWEARAVRAVVAGVMDWLELSGLGMVAWLDSIDGVFDELFGWFDELSRKRREVVS